MDKSFNLSNHNSIVGEFIENLPVSHAYLTIVFSPATAPFKQCWKNNSLSADFIASYLTTFYPGDEAEREEIKYIVNYISNELLENSMKYNDYATEHPITVELKLYQEDLYFWVTNSINPNEINEFKSFLTELMNSDPEEIYFKQLEESAEDENSDSSGLGLLTMINDYSASLAWKFETVQQDPDITTVTTMVNLKV
ncbi:hypothetical protein Lepto7376_3928 [[Leptolyngbya] sp. PCC 7376]|uniref:DUF6272 family protein n=1 Tax=[Leptolyngbya] sp. PCC 7376 TaxID=111781 RepID=UPI00029F3D1B|nr:DUF6272 family protein [[Leptolyngbya] sp. PCC 7376]AFY40077.1 hypothetical protein Lepto7376_3928 [[Leptolyngbya] sp. PCC 7376]